MLFSAAAHAASAALPACRCPRQLLATHICARTLAPTEHLHSPQMAFAMMAVQAQRAQRACWGPIAWTADLDRLCTHPVRLPFRLRLRLLRRRCRVQTRAPSRIAANARTVDTLNRTLTTTQMRGHTTSKRSACTLGRSVRFATMALIVLTAAHASLSRPPRLFHL